MDEIRVKLLGAILGAIFTGTIAGVGTYVTQDSKYGITIENLSKESQSKENKIRRLSDRVNKLQSELDNSKLEINSLTQTYDNLLKEHHTLKEKYERCISSNGLINTVGTIDMQLHEKSLKTGDYLEFKLTSSSLLISIVRVSKEGPIISISGCKNFITENEIKLVENSRTYFIIKPNNQLIIRFTSGSCEDNENIDPSIVEEIILTVKDYNVNKQRTNLNYIRQFL